MIGYMGGGLLCFSDIVTMDHIKSQELIVTVQNPIGLQQQNVDCQPKTVSISNKCVPEGPEER